MKNTTMKKQKKTMTIKKLEKKLLPSTLVSKKPPVPPPYAPGTYYGVASRKNILTD